MASQGSSLADVEGGAEGLGVSEGLNLDRVDEAAAEAELTDEETPELMDELEEENSELRIELFDASEFTSSKGAT